MFESVQLAAIGTAVVLDAVLLVALLERPNRRRVASWMWLMTGATLLFHGASFVHHLLAQASTVWAMEVDRAAMLLMAAGLLTLPAAMLHGGLRVVTTGVNWHPPRDWRFAMPYLVVAAIVPIAADIRPATSRDFLVLTQDFRLAWVIWFVIASGVTAACYWRLRNHPDVSAQRTFLGALVATLAGTAALIAFGSLYAIDAWPSSVRWISLGMTMAPLATVALFMYYVVRFGLLQLLIERSVVYGAIVLAFLLVHQLVVADYRDALSERLRINFAIVEGIAAVALILLYTPFRERAAEGLRYLIGGRVDRSRERTRELSAQMTAMTGQRPEAIIEGVAIGIREVFDLSSLQILLLEPEPIRSTAGGGPTAETLELIEPATELVDRLRRSDQRHVAVWHAASPSQLSLLDAMECSGAVLMEHGETVGLMLIGAKSGHQRVSAEELNALILLAEQLAVTLQLERLQSQRVATERRAMQHEKLSTLGLLAGSIAHEVRNPLSSIKAITTVLAEDLGPSSDHAEDLQLILGEIDRLSRTTSQLLAFARTEPQEQAAVRPAEVLQQTLQLLHHLARRDNVEITEQVEVPGEQVTADMTALREVYFNLLTNSLDAAGSGGRIEVTCCLEGDHVVTRVTDNGPGIAPEIQDRLFEPFATTKEHGTGLGLYIVGRHVRELGGEIHCETAAGSGTQFTLKLPVRRTS